MAVPPVPFSSLSDHETTAWVETAATAATIAMPPPRAKKSPFEPSIIDGLAENRVAMARERCAVAIDRCRLQTTWRGLPEQNSIGEPLN